MKAKLKGNLRTWDYEDLKELEADLKNGGKKAMEAAWEVMKERGNCDKFCAVCFNQLDEKRILIDIGPRKAAFCAFDCLEYFLTHVKSIKNQASNEQFEL